jgi:EAL domain-containing protein (putative c-di-GMP-specific phosphodiesterase class I)
VGDVADALADSGLPADRLTLEITESVLMQDAAATLEKLRGLKALGVRLAVDDFGTGYSSLSALHQFPVDVLKIDKSFVDSIGGGGSNAALARTIVTLAGVMQLRTVAEGVEHPEQRAELVALGCTAAQGYLFARPMGAEDVAAMVGAVPGGDAPMALSAPLAL